jgi:hypothetical protein
LRRIHCDCRIKVEIIVQHKHSLLQVRWLLDDEFIGHELN